MEGVIQNMSQTELYKLPRYVPNNLDVFLETVYNNCNKAAQVYNLIFNFLFFMSIHFQELNSRSCVVEDAVLELIDLVLAGVGDESSEDGKQTLTFDEKEDCGDLDDSRSSKLNGFEKSKTKKRILFQFLPFQVTEEVPFLVLPDQEENRRFLIFNPKL